MRSSVSPGKRHFIRCFGAFLNDLSSRPKKNAKTFFCQIKGKTKYKKNCSCISVPLSFCCCCRKEKESCLFVLSHPRAHTHAHCVSWRCWKELFFFYIIDLPELCTHTHTNERNEGRYRMKQEQRMSVPIYIHIYHTVGDAL